MEKFLVTSALPYANGKLHIGHVAGAYLPADIFVRFQRLAGNQVIYVCGTDEHGAPISIKAEAEGKTPRELVDYYHQSIKSSFEGLNFSLDHFSGTSRPPHHQLSQEFFLTLHRKGFIKTHTIQQQYCEHDKRFLADRYVEGVCPFCGADGARGDQCDACGKLIDAVNLIEPKCKICGSKPVVRETTHWFLDLPRMEADLRSWLATKDYWKDNVHKFIMKWLDEGLIERSITRDTDWGVPVPLPEAAGKVLYVWFDAPIGYISATVEWAEKIGQPELWKSWWTDPEVKLIHFIGKDNIPFHTIIWPGIVMEQDVPYILPHDVPANEFLNLEGRKISTSRDFAVWVEDYLRDFDGDLLRYVLAANAPESKDSDFSWKDFQTRVNSELANVLGNLANRVLQFALRSFDGQLRKPGTLSEKSRIVLMQVEDMVKEIYDSFYNYRVRKAVGLIMDIARLGNRFFDEAQPWVSVKSDKAAAEESLWVCCELLRTVSIVFHPVMPVKMAGLRTLLGLADTRAWSELETASDLFTLQHVPALFPKIEDNVIEEKTAELLRKTEGDTQPDKPAGKPEIEYEDFAKLDIRVVKILAAEKITKSDKLLKLRIDCGGEERDLVAGIAQAYEPDTIVGRKVVMLINLKPRKIMGNLSQGMILAASDGNTLSLLSPLRDMPEGSTVS